MFKRFILMLGGILIMSASITENAQAADPENTIYMRLSTGGTVTIDLKPDLAPNHVKRIKELTREGFYDGLVFHRVIDGFMAQTGDPTGTGMNGSDKPDLQAEFSDYNYTRGTVGMARTQDPNSANSQFFICFNDCSFLNGQYTVWGQVTDGMSEVDKIAKGEPPTSPDNIERMIIAADAQQPEPDHVPETTTDAGTQPESAEPAAGAEPPAAEPENHDPAAAEAETDTPASGEAAE